jgi:hypothetical protein
MNTAEAVLAKLDDESIFKGEQRLTLREKALAAIVDAHVANIHTALAELRRLMDSHAGRVQRIEERLFGRDCE